MSSQYFNMSFEGRVGREPVQRFTPSGKAVTNFTVANTSEYKDANGQKVSKTVWFKCTTWGTLAEIAGKYLKKGSHVLISDVEFNPDENGNPKIVEGNDGKTYVSYDITVRALRMLDAKGSNSNEESSEKSSNLNEDDFPF